MKCLLLSFLFALTAVQFGTAQLATPKLQPDSMYLVTNYIYPQVDRRIFFDYPTFQNSNSELGYIYEITNGAKASIFPLSGTGAYRYFRIQSGSEIGQTQVRMRLRDPVSVSSEPIFFNITVLPRTIDSLVSNQNKSFYSRGIPGDKWLLLSIPADDLELTPKVIFGRLNGEYKLYALNAAGKTSDVTKRDTLFKNMGSGYWFKTKSTTEKWNLTVPFTAQRRTEALLRFTMKKGWKLIGSPYDFPVYWRTFLFENGLQVANDVARLWAYNPETETWREVSKQEFVYPWTAYAAYTVEDEIAVDFYHNYGVNYYATLPPQKVVQTDLAKASLEINNQVLAFGFRANSQDGIDIRDNPLMPASPENPTTQAYFTLNERALTSDFRSEDSFFDWNTSNIKQWTLVLPTGKHELTLKDVDGFSPNTQFLLSGGSLHSIIQPNEPISIQLNQETRFTLSLGEQSTLLETVFPSVPLLHDAFPNPFNPTTTLSFSLPNQSSVLLQVFDYNGRLVQTLINAEKTAGLHQVPFSGVGLASGTYLYRLQVNAQTTLVRKFTLLK